MQSPTSSSSVHEVEMFAHPADPPPGNTPTPDILSISASHRPNQPRKFSTLGRDSSGELRGAILGEMEEESQEQEHMEIHSHSIPAPNWLIGRLRKEPKKEIDPAWELEELLKKMDQPTERKAPRKFSEVVRDESGS